MNKAQIDLNRPLCIKCNRCLAAKSGKVKPDGSRYYTKKCRGCSDENIYGVRHTFRKHGKFRRPYLAHRKTFCEECRFIAVHPGQLDIDHMDGNHFNNDITNLRILCANCHRLKTFTNGDHKKKEG